MNSVGKHLISLKKLNNRIKGDIYQLTKQGYLLMHLLTVNLIMRLQYGYLMAKH